MAKQFYKKTTFNSLLPSHRNLSIHVGQEARSHPTKGVKEMGPFLSRIIGNNITCVYRKKLFRAYSNHRIKVIKTRGMFAEKLTHCFLRQVIGQTLLALKL